MLDLKRVVEEREAVLERLRRRGREAEESLLSADPWALDQKRRTALTEVEGLRHRQRVVGEEIARLGRAKEDTSALRAEMKGVSDSVKELEAGLAGTEEALQKSLEAVPNLPDDSVPVGDPSANAEVRRVGTPRAFDFTPKPHWDLGPELGILDFERAAKISGARFSVLWDDGARLERALAAFMLDLHTRERGYREVIPPYLVTAQTLFGTGNLPKFESDLFKTRAAERDLYLIPTAEVPVTNLHREEILEAEALPLKYTAYTPCFRSEAGSYGSDVRGLIRQHQFDKVELVKFASPETSYDELEGLTRDAERVLQLLGLPYRTVLLCTGDMGFSAHKTYDIEVWLPGQNTYREISSCSNTEAFQARRANIKFRPGGAGKPECAHTLNGSGLAVGRTWIAVLENYQNEDGSITIPEILQQYMGGLERISSVPSV